MQAFWMFPKWLGLLMSILLVGLVAACRPEPQSVPSVLDRNETTIARRSEQLRTATPLASATPSPAPIATFTPRPPTMPPPSPTFPVDRSAFVRQTIPQGEWATVLFRTGPNEQRRLGGFEGQAVVVQTMSTLCDICAEQTEVLAQATDRLVITNNAANLVVLVLSVDELDSWDDLEAYQLAYGRADSQDLTWLMGKASPELLAVLSQAFGPQITNRFDSSLFYVDKFGFAHLGLTEGFSSVSVLEDTLIHFVGGPGVDEPIDGDAGTAEATEEDPLELLPNDDTATTEAPTESATEDATTEATEDP